MESPGSLRRFREKKDRFAARLFCAAGRYFWLVLAGFGCVFGSVLFRIGTFLFPPFSIKDVEEGQKTKSQGKLKKEKLVSGRTEAEKKRDEKERNADDQIDDPVLMVVSFEIENPDKDQQKTDQCGKEIMAQCLYPPTGPW